MVEYLEELQSYIDFSVNANTTFQEKMVAINVLIQSKLDKGAYMSGLLRHDIGMADAFFDGLTAWNAIIKLFDNDTI